VLGNIHITTNDLRDAAQTMQATRTQMEGILNRTSKIMEGVAQDGWQDQSGAMLLARFRQLQARYFHKYPEAIEAFAVFLNNTADNYEKEDAARKADIRSLSNMDQ